MGKISLPNMPRKSHFSDLRLELPNYSGLLGEKSDTIACKYCCGDMLEKSEICFKKPYEEENKKS